MAMAGGTEPAVSAGRARERQVVGGTAAVSALAGVEFRRASLADAEGLTRLMSEPEVLRNTLQLPMPSVEVWRKRLEAQIADPLQIHVLAVHGVELIGSAGLASGQWQPAHAPCGAPGHVRRDGLVGPWRRHRS